MEDIKQIFRELEKAIDDFIYKYFGKYWRQLTHRIQWIYRHGFIKEDNMEWIEPEELIKEEIKKIENEL